MRPSSKIIRTVQVGVIALAVTASLGAIASPGNAGALAVGNCGPQTNPHEGRAKDPSRGMMRGVQADVTIRSSIPCVAPAGGPPSFTTDYVMVFRGFGYTGWSQVGFIRMRAAGPGQPSQPTVRWSQTMRDINDTPHNQFGAQLTSGQIDDYKVRFHANGCSSFGSTYDCFINSINGSAFSASLFNPTTSWGSSPAWHGEFSAESFFEKSNIPGTDTSRVLFHDADYYNSSGTWVNCDCALLDTIFHSDDAHWDHYVDCTSSYELETFTENSY